MFKIENNLWKNFQRKICIWISSPCPTTANVTCNNVKNAVSLTDIHHNDVIIDLDTENPLIKIAATHESIHIGNIETNYSWQINPFFNIKFHKDTETFLKEKFDINNVSKSFVDHLETTDFLVSTGKDGFSATKNLKNNVKINGKNIKKDKEWYELKPGDVFECYVSLPEPAFIDENATSEITTTGYDESMLFSEKCQKYDKSFFDNMDTRFFEFVEKKVENREYRWEDCDFSEYTFDYTQKIRTQAQLVQNKNLIKNKNILDLGTHLGHFLYPCLELGCKSIIGAQYLEKYNFAINEALKSLNLEHKATAKFCDFYDAASLTPLLDNLDTILALGILYHINHHYDFLKVLSKSSASAIVLDTVIRDKNHFIKNEPNISWINEIQTIDGNAKEIQGVNKQLSWVGFPNSAWLIQTMLHLGWNLESNRTVDTFTTTKPQLKTRGVLTFVR